MKSRQAHPPQRTRTRTEAHTKHPHIDTAGRVQATCWCDAEFLWIPQEWVGERTATCGRRGCEPPSSGAPQTGR